MFTPSPKLDLDFPEDDDANNSDIRDDYQSMPAMAKNFSEQIEDGLPTILE